MGDTFQQVLIPLQQAIIWFHGYELLAVRLPDNRVAAVLSSLCAMLGIYPEGQARRIRRRKDLAPHLVLALVETPGGPQRMDVLVAEAIPFWVLGVQIEQLAPEKRPLILALKEEAVEVLYRHFFHIDAEPTPPPQRERPTVSSDSPAQMIAEAAQLMTEAAHLITAEQQTLKERVIALEERHEITEERQQAIGEQQEVVEEQLHVMGDYLVETRERVTALEQQKRGAPAGKAADASASDGPLLTPQQLTQVYALAREIRRERGTPVSAQLAALAEAFGVEDVSDLPERAWQDVLAWFWEQQQS